MHKIQRLMPRLRDVRKDVCSVLLNSHFEFNCGSWSATSFPGRTKLLAARSGMTEKDSLGFRPPRHQFRFQVSVRVTVRSVAISAADSLRVSASLMMH